MSQKWVRCKFKRHFLLSIVTCPRAFRNCLLTVAIQLVSQAWSNKLGMHINVWYWKQFMLALVNQVWLPSLKLYILVLCKKELTNHPALCVGLQCFITLHILQTIKRLRCVMGLYIGLCLLGKAWTQRQHAPNSIRCINSCPPFFHSLTGCSYLLCEWSDLKFYWRCSKLPSCTEISNYGCVQ